MRIGMDIIEIDRVARAAERAHFVERVYTSEEVAYASKRRRDETLAGMFAAKEAAAKALGTGVRGFKLNDIEVAHDALGAPYLRFYGGAAERLGGAKATLSITHDTTSAGAVVLIEEA